MFTMSQWPPSPSVEDAVTALSHEHVSEVTVQVVKSEDDPVISRGSVDQYPIIVDSDDQREAVATIPGKSARGEKFRSEENSSDDSGGPATPPPINAKAQARPGLPLRAKNVSFGEPAYSSSSGNKANDAPHGRGRPRVSHIETGLGGDLHSMITGSRRAPSPYSYSRAPTAETFSPMNTNSVTSPDQLTASPVQTPVRKQSSTSSISLGMGKTRAELPIDEPERRRQPSRSRPRESETGTESKLDRAIPVSSSSAHESNHRSPGTNAEAWQQDVHIRPPMGHVLATPLQSRRGSTEPYQSLYGDDCRAKLTTIRPSHASGAARISPHLSPFASPYTSSAEESHKAHSHGKHARHDNNIPILQRPLSDRMERPHLNGLVNGVQSSRLDKFTVHENEIQTTTARQQSQVAPTIPLTPDPARSMEEYFERALKDNERRSRHGLAIRTSGSANGSPLISPPRTPKIDSLRQSKEYFETNTLSSRPTTRSRPPSIDNGHPMELKSHVSLLSAATTGAAKAARTSGDLSKSGTSSVEHSSGKSTSKPPSASSSRRPSPVFEDPRPPVRSVSYAPAEKSSTAYSGATVVPEVRPSPRGNIYVLDHAALPQAQRAYSYSGHGSSRSNPLLPNALERSQSHVLPAIPTYPVIVPSRTRAFDGPIEVKSMTGNVLTLPSCPRSHPTVGCNDWWSVKEISNIDICPTCMSVLGNTRFRDSFVRSLPRPYNEPSVCAMSKPWLRVAFLQSHRQGRPNLDYMRILSTLPVGTKPCAGGKPDVRMWFDIYDISTKEAVPNFVACSACVRAVDTLFPELESVLGRPRGALIQEKVCSLNMNSRSFPSFIDQLEKAASCCKGRRWRQNDIQPLVDYLRQATKDGGCPRDRMVPTRAWHFMPDLPEFTICEQCYFDVVWPLNDKPIARDISKTTKLVPLPGNSGVSCQLYSERMRKTFREAVMKRSTSQLKEVARTRHGAQQRLVEMNKLYEQDQKYGIDRRAETERNNAIWRQLE